MSQHRLYAVLLLLFDLLECWCMRQSRGLNNQTDFAKPIGNQTVIQGREAVLSCHINNLGIYKVGWVKQIDRSIQAIHKKVVSTDERVYVTHTDDGNVWNLHIKNVHEGDRGEYLCQLNTLPMKTQIGYLEVVVPPDIKNDESSSDLMVPEGSTAKLVCKATGYPKPIVSWRKDTADNNSVKQHIIHEGEVLMFHKINRKDAGFYMCIASNGVPPSVSKRMSVSVHFHPFICVPNQIVGAPRGTDIKLECIIEAYPKPIMFWMRNSGDMLVPTGKYEIIETEVSIFKTNLDLVIHKFDETDAGSYACNAKNSVGDVTTIIRVYEIPGPTAGNKTHFRDPQRRYEKGNFLEPKGKHMEILLAQQFKPISTMTSTSTLTGGASNNNASDYYNSYKPIIHRLYNTTTSISSLLEQSSSSTLSSSLVVVRASCDTVLVILALAVFFLL